MNFIDPILPGKEAVLRYDNGEYQILKTGNYVRCGVTGAMIRLEDVRYWNVEKQCAYRSAEVAFADMAQN
jgi:hypothetical protein